MTLRRFQVRYSNIPGQEKPVQPLEVWYAGGYAQDVWRPKSNVTVTAGLRMDVPFFGDTGYPNANVDALTFRDETGAAVQYESGKLPDATPLWSPRVGFNWDVSSNQTDAGARRHRRLHRQAGLRLDLEPDWQHRRADRFHPGRERHRASPVQSRTRTSTSRRR